MGKHEGNRDLRPFQTITLYGEDVPELLSKLDPPLGKKILHRPCHGCAKKKECEPNIILSTDRSKGNTASVTLQGREMERTNPDCTIFSYIPAR